MRSILTINPRLRWVLFAAAAMLLCCCAEAVPDTDQVPDDPPIEIEIIGIEAPDPVLIGSYVEVAARGVQVDDTDVTLVLTDELAIASTELERISVSKGGTHLFEMTELGLNSFGPGSFPMTAVLEADGRQSAGFSLSMNLATDLSVSLTEALGGATYKNAQMVLRGAGFIASNEGTLEAIVDGTYTAEATGVQATVSTTLPVELAEENSRDRALLRLTTAIGGIEPGDFNGTITVRSTLLSGFASQSDSTSVSLTFAAPIVFDAQPSAFYLGQLVSFSGGGFLGSPEEPSEATVMSFDGTFTDDKGNTSDFGPTETVVVYESGEQVGWGIEPAEIGNELVSIFFGARRGTFEGSITPIVIQGTNEWVGDSTQLRLELSGMTQVVYVVFLPGFYDSLRHYGLSSASAQIEEVIFLRMEQIYQDYAVEFRSEEPTDVLSSAYARLEIGGPDPNGRGLLGYDNTPGKDVGNLRLFDALGGANAETQADGYPGYGGVFIDSYLYWSAHPGLDGDRPFGAPPPDSLFDEIFDPVRNQPATLSEAEGVGDTSRLEGVSRAIQALGSIIGETAAHEIGHSLGLAQPYGPDDQYHSAFPGDGCLMDSGGSRPLGERAGQPGYPTTRFCFDSPTYLEEILGD